MLGRVHTWCHLVALGHGKDRGSFIVIFCTIITGYYSGICLSGISLVWAASGPLLGYGICGKTKSWEFRCKIGFTEHVGISASQITSSFVGRLRRRVMRIVTLCAVLYKNSWSL